MVAFCYCFVCLVCTRCLVSWECIVLWMEEAHCQDKLSRFLYIYGQILFLKDDNNNTFQINTKNHRIYQNQGENSSVEKSFINFLLFTIFSFFVKLFSIFLQKFYNFFLFSRSCFLPGQNNPGCW